MSKAQLTVYIESWIIDELNKRKINKSAFVNEVLKRALRDGYENIDEKMLKIIELEERAKKFEEAIEDYWEWKAEVQKLKQEFQKQQEAKEIEERLDLIKLLEHEYFDDIERLKQRYSKDDLKQFIETRLSNFAAEHKISLPEAWDLFYRVFPDLKEELEV